MTNASTPNTPKERLERFLVLVKRSRTYARSTAAIAIVFMLLSLVLALTAKRVYRSETTVIYRDAVRTSREMESPTQRAARLGPRLKEYVVSRSRLQSTIEQFDLYPDLVRKSMLDALEEMQKHISFRTRSQDTFVLSYSHENPETARAVAAHLAETMIADYTSDNLDSALTTHDVLRTEVESAQKHVEETSRALARFLAKHPQFTWGMGDSPYASGQQMGSAANSPRETKSKSAIDPVMSQLLEKLHAIDAELAGPSAVAAPALPMPTDAQKQRDAAAAALATAQAELEKKLLKVTKAHPDAMVAQSHVDRARAALAAAEANLTQAIAAAAPPPPPENPGLDPTRKAELETQRKSVVAQIAERRSGGKKVEPAGGNAPEAKTAAPDIVELETEWHKLRLDLERARDAFRKAEDKERVARLQATSAEVEVQESLLVSDPAYLPVHPESGRGRVFFAGSLVAIFLALGYAVARVLLCDTLFDEGDVLALGNPPLLVSVPHIPNITAPFVRAACHPVPPVHPTKKDKPLVRRDEPQAETNDPLDVEIAMDGQDEPAEPRSKSLVPISLPAIALQSYVEPRAPNLVVVGVPYTHSGGLTDDVVRDSPASVLGALRVLRHRLEQRRGDDSLVVSVQSAIEGEGKTTIATRLALTLAESERARVVLVEGNLSRPKLALSLGLRLPDDLGMTMQIRQHMGGKGDPWNIVRIGASLYALVESNEQCVFPAALHSIWFPSIIRELKAAYDYVVIDGCAVLDAGDANVLEEVSDTVVLVTRAGVTSGSMVSNTVRQLGDRRLFGLVLNDMPTRQR